MERLNLGNFFYDFFHEDASPKKKTKQKKGTETTQFCWWLTASQGSQITPNQPFHKAMDFLPIEIRAAWPEVQAKSWIPYVLLICHKSHISQPPGNSAWQMFFLYWSSTVYSAFIGDPETSCRLQYQILIKWQLFTTFKMWKRCIHDEIESSTLDLGEFEISPTWTTWNGIKISVETTKRHISQQDPKLQKLWGRLPCTSLRQIPFWYVTGFVTA